MTKEGRFERLDYRGYRRRTKARAMMLSAAVNIDIDARHRSSAKAFAGYGDEPSRDKGREAAEDGNGDGEA
jgi:hypothetical protein